MDELYDTIFAMGGGGASSASTPVSSPAPTDAGLMSGLLQQSMTIAGNYVNRRLDIDLASRLAGNQATPYLYSRQTPQYGTTVTGTAPDLTTRGVAAVGGLRMGDLLPIIGVALVAYMFLGKR